MKRVLCLYTGGTIGCQPTPTGLAPAPGTLTVPLQALAHRRSLDLDLLEYPLLLDSSSQGPSDWNRIGQDIANQYDNFDGFIVLHGTDTLAYTAAALSFQLENLCKPVIITGSQRPWWQANSDAPTNVAQAFAALHLVTPGVRVVFGGKTLPGACVRKVDADADMAFDAPNWSGKWPPLCGSGTLHFTPVNPENRIIGIKLYPGTTYDWLAQALTEPLQGIILETYGSGNLPEHAGLIRALEKQAAAGAIIINCTQCPRGQVRQGQYASSAALTRIGAIPAEGMTPEASLARLYWLLAKKANASNRVSFTV